MRLKNFNYMLRSCWILFRDAGTFLFMMKCNLFLQKFSLSSPATSILILRLGKMQPFPPYGREGLEHAEVSLGISKYEVKKFQLYAALMLDSI
jgi:hypothetical protein